MFIPLFMKSPAGSALSARTNFISSCRSGQEGKLTSYSQGVNYLLKTYATDDIIVEANREIIS